MRTLITFTLLASVAACGDDGGSGNEGEVITTVVLTFTPAGGAPIVAEFDDPDGDGGLPPTVDPIALTAGSFMLTVQFQNRLEDPPEEITDEVRDEGDEHQLFFTGTAINGPATNNPSAPLMQSYTDADAGGLPIGLSNTIVATAGTGQLTLTLRHLPPVGGSDVKIDGLAAMVKAGGINAIGGDTDVQVNFTATVQ